MPLLNKPPFDSSIGEYALAGLNISILEGSYVDDEGVGAILLEDDVSFMLTEDGSLILLE